MTQGESTASFMEVRYGKCRRLAVQGRASEPAAEHFCRKTISSPWRGQSVDLDWPIRPSGLLAGCYLL